MIPINASSFYYKKKSPLNNIRFTNRQISDIIFNLNVNKTTGADEIIVIMLKEVYIFHYLSTILYIV